MIPKRLLAFTLFAALAVAPDARAQWVPVGPEGGSVLSFAAMGRYTFAGTSGGTLYRSSNAGASWSRSLKTTNTDIEGIAVSDSTVFVASDSLYVSNDSGVTWTARPYLYDKAGFLGVLGPYLYYAAQGVYRTSDKGAIWEPLGTGHSQCLMIKGGDIYVGGLPGLSRSTDSGKTWTSIAIVDSIYDRIESLAFDGNNIFAGSYYQDKFYRSTDNGITWDTTSIGLPPIGNQGPYKLITSIYQDSTILFAGTALGLYRSLDTGTSWTKISSMLVQSFFKSGGYLLAGTATDGIVRTTDDGQHWISSNTGIDNLQITAFASIGSHLFVGVNGKGIYRSDDSGASFTAANTGIDSLKVAQIVAIDTMLFAFTQAHLFRSSNFGNSWDTTPVKASVPATAIGSSLIATNNGSFVLSSDGGRSWTKRGNELFSLACPMFDGTNLYAAGDGDIGSYVLYSTDSGLTWNLSFNPDSFVYSLASDGDYLFAGTGPRDASSGHGIFRKAKTDSVWSNYWWNNDDYTINSIVAKDRDVFFSTDEEWNFGEGAGVFHSSDFGSSWSAINEGLTALVVPQLFIFPPYIFAGTQSSSVWRRPLSEMVTSSADSIILIAPPDDSQIFNFSQIYSMTFLWHALPLARNYVFSIRSGLWDSTITTVDTSVIVSLSLAAGGYFSWSVYAQFNSGTSPPSVRTLIDIYKPVYTVTPPNGIGNVSIPIHFNWTAPLDKYGSSWGMIRVATNRQLTQVVMNDTLFENYITISDFKPNTTYYWAVGVNGIMWNLANSLWVWSDTATFTTGDFSSVTDPAISNQTIRSYPNPLSQSTEITLTADAAGYADVSIVNLLGVEVAHLFSGELAAGEHSFAWSNPIVPDGMYECLVRMNGRVEKLPMVLMR
ncbi:MAG: WD40/YVTN/BNR-like repeat-containing protein [Candidatus Kapaibacterium sp.]